MTEPIEKPPKIFCSGAIPVRSHSSSWNDASASYAAWNVS